MPTDDDIYSNLPDDNELAFIQLESALRVKLDQALRNPQNTMSSSHVHYLEYLNKVSAAVQALELPILQNMTIPTQPNHLQVYDSVSRELEHYLIMIKIRRGRRTKGYSVALDAVTKEKVRHLIGQITTIVDRLQVTERKKEALYARIRDLTEEVNRTRTKAYAFASGAINIL
jgi:hypothetical protein